MVPYCDFCFIILKFADMTDYDKIEKTKSIILEILSKCGIAASVEFEESITKGLVYNINSPESYFIIGRQGSALRALQILTQALAAKRLASSSSPFWFSIDVDDYKRKREWYLKETAKSAAEQLKKTGRSVALEPMPNYERRLIHAYLQELEPSVESLSIGREPYRKVVIRIKKQTL